MNEKTFYDLCDKADELNGDLSLGYFPTIEELEKHDVSNNFEKFAPVIIYFASNPFSRSESLDAEDPDYLKTVKYCKKILANIELSE